MVGAGRDNKKECIYMSYKNGTPNGELWIGTVKWSDDYKHVMHFPNKNTLITFLKSHLTKQKNEIIAISNPNGYIDVEGTIGGLEVYNYLMYKNDSDFSNNYFFCFITDWEIVAERTTRLYIKLDIFQQYFYDTTFFKSIVERAHISKNEDNNNWENYTAPEPIGAPAEIDRAINIFNDINFKPVLTFDAISKPDTPEGSSQLQYEYGGTGTDPEDMTGYYRFRVTDAQYLTAVLYFWSMGETETSLINHMSDLVGFNYLPQWVVSRADWVNYNNITTFVKELNNNNLTTISDTVNVNSYNNDGKQILACGYPPVNKKMLTNLCRGFKLWTKNGTSIPIAPNSMARDGNGNITNLTVNVSMRPMGATYKVELAGYKDFASRYFDLQYSYNIAFGINNNVGTAQQTALQALTNQSAILKAQQNKQVFDNIAGAVNTVVSAGVGIAGGVASGNYYGAVSSAVQGVTNVVGQAYAMDIQNAQMKSDNFNMQTSINDAVNSQSASIGNNSDRTTMNNDFCKLRLSDCSPTIENCRIIDDFLTVYGYAISEIKPPQNFFNSRPLFNYVKTNGINLHTLAPANYENALKKIFDNGVTLWHYTYHTDSADNVGYEYFGDYERNNWYD